MTLSDVLPPAAPPTPAVARPAGPDHPGDLEEPAFLGARHRPRWRSLVLRAAVPIVIVGLWWYLTTSGTVSPAVLASPGKVWAAFQELRRSGELVTDLWWSARRAVLGVSIGATLGLVLGVLSGLSKRGEELVDPTMQMLRAVPFLALVPLYIAWFGIDETFKVVLIASASMIPMYAYAYLGVRGVDRKVVEAARTFGLSRRRLVTDVVLPSALPSVLMGLRISAAISITALIAAEDIGTEHGIGYLVLQAKQYFRTDYMVLCIVLYALLGLAFDGCVRLIERYALPWRRAAGAR